MSKAAAFTTELTTTFSPNIWRRGYMHRKIDGDTNGRISSFHDVKTAYKGDYDSESIFLYSDLHYTDWDHSYGTEYAQLTVTPSDTTFLSEAWTPTTTGTGSASIVNGVLKLKAPTSSTVYYIKQNVFDTVAVTTGDALGAFTLEFEYRKGTDESSNANPFVAVLKCGTFHVQLTCNLTTVKLEEIGGSSTTVSNINLADATWSSQEGESPTDVDSSGTALETAGAVEYGGTHIFRIIIDKKRTAKKAVLLVDRVERASVNHTVANTTANQIEFGYETAPTSRSFSYVGYLRYHNAPFYPVETNEYAYNANGGVITASASEPDALSITTGAFTTNALEVMAGTKNKNSNNLVNTADGATISKSTVTQAGSIGNAAEFRLIMNGGGTGITINHYDGTYLNQMIFTSSGLVSINGTSLSAGSGLSYHIYRMVQRNGTSYLYVDGELEATTTPTSDATASKFEIVFNGALVDINLDYLRLMKRPAHPTRTSNQVYIAIGNAVAESTLYYRSDVTNNNLLDDVTAELSSAYVLQKDLCWGESGYDSDIAMYQRGSASSFAKGDASPSYTAVTASTDLSHRDAYTEYKTQYFQTKIELTKQTQELNFMRYHRQICITDLVTGWGTSTFDRDVNTRRIEAGDVRIQLMNGAGEFDLFKTNPEKWANSYWETWIGVTVSEVEYAYPDFIGEIADMVFEYGTPYVILEVTNIIKNLKEIELARQFQYPPYSKQKVFYGGACYKFPTRASPDNSDQGALIFSYLIDSKYNLGSIDKVFVQDRLVWLNGTLLDSENYSSIRVNTNSPCSVVITPTTSGTPPNQRPTSTPNEVTVSFTPLYPKNRTNPGSVLKDILQVEGKLLMNYDIDSAAFNTYENEIDGIFVYNIELSQVKMFDFIEKLVVQCASSAYISSDTQTAIAVEQFGKVRLTHTSIAHANLSDAIPGCSDIRVRNPIENVLNLVDVEYDSEKQKKFYTYKNTLTVGSYNAASTIASTKVIDVFGIRTPAKRFQGGTDSQSVPTEYPIITDIDNMSSVTTRNFDFYGYRPSVYELMGCHLDIFIYSFRDVLYIYGTDAVTPDDTIEITRIEKDYDNLTGSVQGISNKFFQFPGGSTINRAYAVDDTVCVLSDVLPCDITGQTVNEDFWYASDTAGDANVAYATT